MVIDFECHKCKKVYSQQQYELSQFCPVCGNLLMPRRLKTNIKFQKNEIKTIEVRPEDINLESLFYEFKNFQYLAPGDGKVFKTVDEWIWARKEAYKYYQEKFVLNETDHEKLAQIYKEWLLFKNNLSWTTLQRTGYYALKEPKQLKNLLVLMRDESLDIGDRITRGLEGSEKVYGMGVGILTAFLHTMFPEKYGVWNIRTKETLSLLHLEPQVQLNIGLMYKEVNNKLYELANVVKSDLTTIDGFMWYVSKRVKVLA